MSRPPAIYTESPIAQALINYKNEHKLTLEQMAEQIGLNSVSLGRLTKFGCAPSMKALKTLARFFNWTAGEVGVMTLYPGPKKKWRRNKGDSQRDRKEG